MPGCLVGPDCRSAIIDWFRFTRRIGTDFKAITRSVSEDSIKSGLKLLLVRATGLLIKDAAFFARCVKVSIVCRFQQFVHLEHFFFNFSLPSLVGLRRLCVRRCRALLMFD